MFQSNLHSSQGVPPEQSRAATAAYAASGVPCNTSTPRFAPLRFRRAKRGGCLVQHILSSVCSAHIEPRKRGGERWDEKERWVNCFSRQGVLEK